MKVSRSARTWARRTRRRLRRGNILLNTIKHYVRRRHPIEGELPPAGRRVRMEQDQDGEDE